MISVEKKLHWRKVLVIVLFIYNELVLGKINDSGKKSGQGWPNFFNPKQSVLKENGDKDTRKMEKKDKSNPLLSNESTDSGIHSSLNNKTIEDLFDYTIKGRLRGTYAILNFSSDIANLEEEAQTAIRNILKIDDRLFKDVDEELRRGELTEEGIRLHTPILLKTHSEALGKYGARISFCTGEEFTKVIYFGNWCGRGGRSSPVDNIDGCCMEQEKCYGKHVRQCPDIWKRPYHLMYAWLVMNKDPVCVRFDSSCVNHVCECDREAAFCLRHFMQNPIEIPLHVDPQPRISKRMEKKKPNN